MAEKYVIFKKGEFDEWWEKETRATVLAHPLPRPIGDAAVIRLQDVFSAAGFAGYASSMAVTTDVLRKIQAGHMTVEEALAQLQPSADYFHEMSEAAYDMHSGLKKLPD